MFPHGSLISHTQTTRSDLQIHKQTLSPHNMLAFKPYSLVLCAVMSMLSLRPVRAHINATFTDDPSLLDVVFTTISPRTTVFTTTPLAATVITTTTMASTTTDRPTSTVDGSAGPVTSRRPVNCSDRSMGVALPQRTIPPDIQGWSYVNATVYCPPPANSTMGTGRVKIRVTCGVPSADDGTLVSWFSSAAVAYHH
jgi:hypothetical protein